MKTFARWTAIIALLYSHSAFCQEDPHPEKPDLSNPDTISLPPMDPYALSYTPDKPENAKAILTPDECAKNDGQWTTNKNVRDIDNVTLNQVGCKIHGKAEGRWIYIDASKPGNEIEKKDAYGYVWMVDGKKVGWEAIFTGPDDFVRFLTPYKDDKIDGTAFEWNEMGALRQVTTYQDGIRNGKYEHYEECLPTALGQYTNDKPTGTWTIYAEPGMISMRRNYDRKATPQDLPEGAQEIEAYWTEWFNGDGVRITEGFSASTNPEDTGTRLGTIQLYSVKGNKWLAIQYDKQGRINDQPTFDLCVPEDNPKAPQPSFLDYDHENLIIKCKNFDSDVYKEIYFYETGEKWKFVPIRNSMMHGMVHEFHPTGERLADYFMQDDIPEGKVVYYNRAGVPFGPATTVLSGSGDFKSWWHNGFPKEEGRYELRQKDGMWRSWYDSGSIEKETNYSAGKRDGVEKHWFSNGVLSSETNYAEGARNGTAAAYYTDGHIAFKYNFAGGRLHGMCYDYTHAGNTKYETNYVPSGQPEQTRFYTDGKKQSSGKAIMGFSEPLQEGIWTYYMKNGTAWYTANYEGGFIVSDKSKKCENIFGQYEVNPDNHEVGCLVCAVNRKSPLAMYQVREDEWEWYNENGKIEKRGSIHMGHLTGNWEYHYPNGMIMLSGSYEIDKKTGEWTGYYEDGTKKFSGSYKNGLETGTWKTYYEMDNIISSEGKFSEGKRSDKWIWYYANGKVREEGNFENGMETGTWTSYYQNGNKQGEGEFVEGKREGMWTWWREDGSVWRTANYVKGREK